MPRGEQAVDQAVVEVEASLVDPAAALREYAWPSNGEPVGADAQGLHQVEIQLPPAIVIASNGVGAAVGDSAGCGAKPTHWGTQDHELARWSTATEWDHCCSNMRLSRSPSQRPRRTHRTDAGSAAASTPASRHLVPCGTLAGESLGSLPDTVQHVV
jgi:hypothetical protein